MSNKLLSPPQPEVCLTRSYKSREVKGGTVIADDVWDREVHRQKLLDPDDYRGYIGPCWNPDCDCAKVHALCFRIRVLYPARKGHTVEEEDIRLYRCPKEKGGCGAVYTVLPAFVARHLWRNWQTVEDVCEGKRKAPRSTTERWYGRLVSSAKQLVQLFQATVVQTLKGSLDWVKVLSDNLTRGGFINTLQLSKVISPPNSFAQIAAWIHRIEPGVRLM
jgi:hypothetical protein